MSHVQYVKEPLRILEIRFLPIYVVWAIIAFWFLINGASVVNGWEDGWTTTTLFYIAGVSLFAGIHEQLPKEYETPLVNNLIGAAVAFLTCTTAFILIYDSGLFFQEVIPLPLHSILPILVFQAAIVVASEELIFRGALYRFIYLKFKWLWAVLLSSLAFSLFHFAAYGGQLPSLAFAFLFGIILAILADRWNLGVSMGVHLAWNAFVLGATALC